MNLDQDDHGQPSLILTSVLSRAFDHFKKEFQFFISVSLIYALLSEGGGYLIGKLNIPSEEQLLLRALINIVFASWASIVIIYAAFSLTKNKKIHPQLALALARQCYGRYLSVYLALISVVICGFFLLIVPGLYFMTLFLFVDILVVVDKASFRQAFRQSAMMVRPFFWKVFAYLIIVVSISLIPELIYQVGLKNYSQSASALQKVSAVIIMPFLLIAQVELFTRIRVRVKLDLTSLEDRIDSAWHDD